MIHSARLRPLTELISMLQTGDLPTPSVKPVQTGPREATLNFKDTPPQSEAASFSGSPEAKLLYSAKGTELHGQLKMASKIAVDGENLDIAFSTGIQVEFFKTEANMRQLKDVARKAFGLEMNINVHNGDDELDLPKGDELPPIENVSKPDEPIPEAPEIEEEEAPSSAPHPLKQDEKIKALFENNLFEVAETDE